MKGLLVAVQFLTRLPTPRVPVSSGEFAASICWFPAVGLVIGAIVAAGGWAGARLDGWTGALTALLLWVAVTGALHLDGLGDIADARGAAHKDRARLLAALADPHAGSFAIVAIILQLLAKLVLLHGLIDAVAYGPIALAAFAARIGPLLWAAWLPDLHAGLGSRFRDAVRPIHLVLWAMALAGVALVFPFLLLTPLLLLGWGWWLRHAIGGVSGDGHGAGIETTESLLLLAALVWVRVA